MSLMMVLMLAPRPFRLCFCHPSMMRTRGRSVHLQPFHVVREIHVSFNELPTRLNAFVGMLLRLLSAGEPFTDTSSSGFIYRFHEIVCCSGLQRLVRCLDNGFGGFALQASIGSAF